MARRRLRLAGIGAPDLPNQAAVESYVGSSRELVAGDDTLRLHDGVTPGGIPLATRGHTPINDRDFECGRLDAQVVMMTLTAARGGLLPAAATFPFGQDLVVADGSGACSETRTITIRPRSGDVLGTSEGTAILFGPYQSARFRRVAANLWIRL